MEEQPGSLITRTRFCHSVYHQPEASRLDSISFTLQPRSMPRSNPSSPDSAISSRTRPSHVTQTQQTASDPISELKDSQDFNDSAGSMQPPHSRRKEQKKGYFGKLLHKHSHNIKTSTSTSTSTSSSSDSKSLSRVSTFLKHVKWLLCRMPRSPAMERH